MMNNNQPVVWQVSAGHTNRSHLKECLKFGVALMGPGDAGPWHADRPDTVFQGGLVRRFATELCLGDVLLLRTGLSSIAAIGLVASEYQYLAQFDDVNGLDLQHARRVRWTRLPDPYDFGEKVFGAGPSPVSRVQSETVVEFANKFVSSDPTEWKWKPLPPLPPEEPALVAPPVELGELVAQVNDLENFYHEQVSFGDLPKEDELVAHYVVPFLRALGWPVEWIAVKWQNIDVSVFTKMPRIPEHCHYLIEAKRLGVGFDSALNQVKGYVSALGVLCDVVVTDGIRYRMYEAKRDFSPMAYANLGRLKQSSLELFDRMSRPK